MRVKYDRKQANLDFGVDLMLIGVMEPSRRKRTLSMRGLSTSRFIIVKYLHFLSIFPSFIYLFAVLNLYILQFYHRSHHNQIVSFSPTKGARARLIYYNDGFVEIG